MKTILTLGSLGLGLTLTLGAYAQAPLAAKPATFGDGLWADVGVGNGLGAHVGYFHHDWLLLGRARYKWWGPDAKPGNGFTEHLNTRSRQAELAALAGYSRALGGSLLYAATGLAYVAGRELGTYRYTLRSSGLLSGATHHYSYRDYQALGLPLELGIMLPSIKNHLGPGLSLQANLNPEHSDFCAFITFWLK